MQARKHDLVKHKHKVNARSLVPVLMWVRTLKRENLRVMGTRDVSDVLLVCALIHPWVQLGVYGRGKTEDEEMKRNRKVAEIQEKEIEKREPLGSFVLMPTLT